MPARPRAPCTTPGCRNLSTAGGRCDACTTRRRADSDRVRGSAAERGYGKRWATVIRPHYLLAHPWCALCGQAATVPDHYPCSRKELLAAGVADPDADEHLRPLCDPCHHRETALHQPGGWNRR